MFFFFRRSEILRKIDKEMNRCDYNKATESKKLTTKSARWKCSEKMWRDLSPVYEEEYYGRETIIKKNSKIILGLDFIIGLLLDYIIMSLCKVTVYSICTFFHLLVSS